MRFALPLILCLSPLCAVVAQSGPGGVGSSASNILWLDANNGITLTSGAISTWADRSGNGNNAVQPIANQRPLPSTNAMNGYPTVLFDNDQVAYDFLQVPDNSTLEGMSGLTGFVVYQLLTGTSASAPRCFFSKRDGVDTQEAYDWFLWNSGSNVVQNLDIVNTNNRATSSGNYTPGTTYVNGFTYHGATPSDVNDQTLYDGNSAVGTRSETSTSIPNYSSNLYVGILRGHTGTGANVSRFNGHISEIIVYNTVLNNAQRIIVNNYLAAKYGTTLGSLDLYQQDAPANGNYDHDVAGIGRTTSAHIQADSKGSGMVQINNAAGLDDNEFMLWGHDLGVPGTFGVSDVPIGIQGRWQRTWRVSEVNMSNSPVDVGSVDVIFDLSAYSSVNADHLRLLVDTDNDGIFADESPITDAFPVSPGYYRFAGVTALANNTRFTLGTTNIAQTPLPVTLTSFQGEEEGPAGVRLDWTTASERYNERFNVERSIDLLAWQNIAEVAAFGTSNTTLHYTSRDPFPHPATNYYRLRQTDLDGTSTLSAVISVTSSNSGTPSIFPNPAAVAVEVALLGQQIDRVEVLDLHGRTVLEQIGPTNDRTTVPLQDLMNGQYSIRITAGGHTFVRQLSVAAHSTH